LNNGASNNSILLTCGLNLFAIAVNLCFGGNLAHLKQRLSVLSGSMRFPSAESSYPHSTMLIRAKSHFLSLNTTFHSSALVSIISILSISADTAASAEGIIKTKFDPERPAQLRVDGSDIGYGASLEQGGRIIANFSRAKKKSETARDTFYS
jgi:hypothetical protein